MKQAFALMENRLHLETLPEPFDSIPRRMSYSYHRAAPQSPRTAASKDLKPATKALTRLIHLADEVQALAKVLEEEWQKLAALENEGNVPPTGPYRTSAEVRGVLQQINKGHFQDAQRKAEWILKEWRQASV